MRTIVALLCLVGLNFEACLTYRTEKNHDLISEVSEVSEVNQVNYDRRLYAFTFDKVPPENFRNKKLVSYEKISDKVYIGYYQ